MLESKVYKPEHKSEDNGGHHHKDSGTLEFVPGRPRCFLRELYSRLFNVVNKLTHLYI